MIFAFLLFKCTFVYSVCSRLEWGLLAFRNLWPMRAQAQARNVWPTNQHTNLLSNSRSPSDLGAVGYEPTNANVPKTFYSYNLELVYLNIKKLNISVQPSFVFITAPLVQRGRDQQMANFHLLLHQPSIGPIRAKQINWCSSLIGRQYWRLKAEDWKL